jgi:hypothetical protein
MMDDRQSMLDPNPYQSPREKAKAADESSYGGTINRLRILNVAVFAVCGTGIVICANLDPGGGTDFGPGTQPYGISFAIGCYASLAFTAVLVMEGIVRFVIGRSLRKKWT